MKRDYRDPAVHTAMYKELKSMLVNAANDILNQQGGHLYSMAAHQYLIKNGWEIMFPLEREKWPEIFHQIHPNNKFPWPEGTTHTYVTDVLCPPFINFSFLFFGYAVIDGKLMRATFFAVETMVEYQAMPQAMVVDPLCLIHGLEPEYYIGCGVTKEDMENFLIDRKNPLEILVERTAEAEHKKRLFDSYMESYQLQLQVEPGYFPPQLIKFAEENDLYIPPQEKAKIFC